MCRIIAEPAEGAHPIQDVQILKWKRVNLDVH